MGFTGLDGLVKGRQTRHFTQIRGALWLPSPACLEPRAPMVPQSQLARSVPRVGLSGEARPGQPGTAAPGETSDRQVAVEVAGGCGKPETRITNSLRTGGAETPMPRRATGRRL